MFLFAPINFVMTVKYLIKDVKKALDFESRVLER